MSDPIRVDKEDRYLSEHTQKTSLPAKPPLSFSRTKWIILVLGLFVFVLIISFAVFKPSKEMANTQIESNTVEQQTDEREYQTLTPPIISSEATKTAQQNSQSSERIEIPGEVLDLLAKKIDEINTNDDKASLQLNSKNTKTDHQFNEKPLTKQLDDIQFTIQLSASSSLESLLALVKQNNISNYQIYETRRDNKPWFVLIKGNYSSSHDAKEAIKSLPSAIQKNIPWIKSGTNVKKEKLAG